MEFVKHPHVKLAISLSGIFLVFLTFVVKDDYREGMKGRSDEISNAESTFLIRSEIEQLEDVVNQSAHQRALVHTVPLENEGGDSSWISPNDTPKEILKQFERYQQDVRNSEVTMDNIHRLLEGLPADSQTETRITEIRALEKHFDGGLFEVLQLAAEESNNPKGLKNKTVMSDALLRKASDELALYEPIMQKVDALGWSALTRAESARTTAERDFRRWNTLSYVIQGLGVVLGIFGLLLGVDVHI